MDANDLFRVTSEADSKVLLYSDFTATNQQVSGISSIVAYHDVPLGHAEVLLADKPVRAFLKARFNTAFVADAAATRVIDLATPGLKMIQSTRTGAAFPNASHPDVLAYISNDGGVTLARATIAACNFLTGQVTVNKIATTNYIAVYYLSADGELEVKAYRPVGGDTVAGRLFNKPMRGLAEIDQTNDRSAMRLNISNDVMLPSQFRLALEVRSTGIIAWDALAEHDFLMHVKTASIQILDLQNLNAEAEKQLRGGNW
jgi:hypothetical protein